MPTACLVIPQPFPLRLWHHSKLERHYLYSIIQDNALAHNFSRPDFKDLDRLRWSVSVLPSALSNDEHEIIIYGPDACEITNLVPGFRFVRDKRDDVPATVSAVSPAAFASPASSLSPAVSPALSPVSPTASPSPAPSMSPPSSPTSANWHHCFAFDDPTLARARSARSRAVSLSSLSCRLASASASVPSHSPSAPQPASPLLASHAAQPEHALAPASASVSILSPSAAPLSTTPSPAPSLPTTPALATHPAASPTLATAPSTSPSHIASASVASPSAPSDGFSLAKSRRHVLFAEPPSAALIATPVANRFDALPQDDDCDEPSALSEPSTTPSQTASVVPSQDSVSSKITLLSLKPMPSSKPICPDCGWSLCLLIGSCPKPPSTTAVT